MSLNGHTELTGARASANRIYAMLVRYWYLLSGSWPRIFSLIYWPTVSMLMWGFVQRFVQEASGDGTAGVFSFLIAAVILWDVLFRGQIGFSVSFYEEIWSRNLGHLLVSPLRLWEFVVALMAASFIRAAISVIPASLLAIVIFDFSVFSLGPALGLFLFSLIVFGWSLGLLVAGLVMRYGQSAEELAWGLVFSLLPLCGVYYPTSVLPEAVRWLSNLLPPKYIFDGMRQILAAEKFEPGLLVAALSLNALYLVLGSAVFLYLVDQARDRGMLLSVGE